MTVKVADRDVGLEARALAGRRLLLHGLDRHDFVLELARGRREEVVDDLVLLDRHAVKEDLLERADAALLYEAAELGDRDPLVLVVAAASAPAPAAPAAPAAVSAAAEAAAAAAALASVFSRGSTHVAVCSIGV